jgi:cell division protein FtsI (penicillin-binding protein 3)
MARLATTLDAPRVTADRRRIDPARLIALAMALAFIAIAARVLHLSVAMPGASSAPKAHLVEPMVRAFARPDIVDRKGRLLATDLTAYALHADPVLVIDPDETSERIAALLPDLNQAELRASLADRSRRFVRIRRQLSPALAQRIHDLGLPGIAFRNEPRRIYPQGRLAGHVLGFVNAENRGMAGIERHIDEAQGLETGYSADFSRPPVTLTLDTGAQHALEEELSLAMARYAASGAAGVVLDVESGAILAAASLPRCRSGEPERDTPRGPPRPAQCVGLGTRLGDEGLHRGDGAREQARRAFVGYRRARSPPGRPLDDPRHVPLRPAADAA